jgi:hypothetical protein
MRGRKRWEIWTSRVTSLRVVTTVSCDQKENTGLTFRVYWNVVIGYGAVTSLENDRQNLQDLLTYHLKNISRPVLGCLKYNSGMACSN